MGHDETTKLKIAVIQCVPGSTVTKGSAVVVSKAVQILGPKAVFCVGFCGGLNNRKVKLGDVVISEKLITYAPSTVTDNGVVERGVRVPSKTYLADLIKTAGHGWEAPLKDPRNLEVKVHRDGVFLSGPEVVDSKERRDQLIKRFPDAIAIEMEGEGLYAAAHDLDVEWVVIKGVSDLADGKKSETDSWRPFASTMAASLTAHILSDAIVFEDWPHYGNMSVRKRRFSSTEDPNDPSISVPPKLPMKMDCEVVRQDANDSGVTPQKVLCRIADRYFQTLPPSTPEEYNEFQRYLREVRNILMVDVAVGSLIITLECSSLEILEGLWEDYCSGHLNKMAQKCLVTKDILRESGLLEVKLITTILEEDYRACREFFTAPSEIEARGPRAQLAYENALKSGEVKLYRARIMFIGQDRAGKTSLKKSFLGRPFDPNEQSTDGIEIDPSKFEIDVDQVKNWQPTDEKLGVSQFAEDLTRMLIRKLDEEQKQLNPVVQDKPKKTRPLENQVPNREETVAKEGENTISPSLVIHMVSHSANATTRESAIPQLNIDPTLPPEEVVHLLDQHLKGLNLQSDATSTEHHLTLDLWDFAGQNLYYASYPVFLSSRAVYMLVYNLSKGLNDAAKPSFRHGNFDTPLKNPNNETNLENLLSWLVSVSTMSPRKPVVDEKESSKNKDLPYVRPPVFIIGTHADKPVEYIDRMKQQIEDEISGHEYTCHVIRPIFSVDNTQGSSGEGIRALQKRMIEVLKEQPYIGEKVPVR